MKKVVSKTMGATLGPATVKVVASTSAYKGAAGITWALSTLGGPAGMFGGIIVTGALSVLGASLMGRRRRRRRY